MAMGHVQLGKVLDHIGDGEEFDPPTNPTQTSPGNLKLELILIIFWKFGLAYLTQLISG